MHIPPTPRNIAPSSFLNSNWAYWFFLLLAGVISYGLQIGRLGFFWDDWQAVYLFKTHSLGMVWEFFKFDRPFSTWTYALLFPLLKMYPIAWQALVIGLRWLVTICLYQILVEVFPSRAGLMRWVGMLFIVYPGFPLQSVALAFSQHFITYLLFTLSILSMIWYARAKKPRGLWLGLGLLASLLQLLTMEYFAVLEFIRPLVLWFVLEWAGESYGVRIRRVLKTWWPFLFPLLVFFLTRFVFFGILFGVREAHPPLLLLNILHSPFDGLLRLANAMLTDGLQMTIFAWVNTIDPQTINLKAVATLVSWGLGLLVAVLFLYWNLRRVSDDSDLSKPTASPDRRDPFYLSAAVFGLAFLILGEFPVWMIGNSILIGQWSDRYSLAPMLGAILLVVVGIDWMVRTQRQKYALLAILLAISVALQVRTTNKYRLDADIQHNYYWQLFWRAPDIQPGTTILAPGVSSSLISRFSVGFGIASLYGRPPLTNDLQHWFLVPKPGDPEVAALLPGYPIEFHFRNLNFHSSTSTSLVVDYAPAVGCVRIVTPETAADPVLRDSAALANLTNLERIQTTDAVIPDGMVFGTEPAHTWCYFYEKADLAAQQKDWRKVIEWMDEAGQKGFVPQTGGELLPLMDAYANSGEWEHAFQTSQKAQTLTIELEPMLCSAWQRYAGLPGLEKTDFLARAKSEYHCP